MKSRQVATVVIAIFIFIFFLFLNYIQPLRADDFGRACTDVLAKGLIMMVHSVEADYFGWTGRVSAQALIYTLLSKKYIGFSLFVVNVVNALAFVVFMIVSFKIVTLDKLKVLSKDFLIYATLFIFVFYQTGFIANILWKTAAIQYFWGITLLVVLYYMLIIKNKESVVFALFVGCLISLYNEIFVAVSLLLCVAYFLDKKIYKQQINFGVITFFISCLIGGVILITAPGNFARLNAISHGPNTSLLSNIYKLIYQIVSTPSITSILLLLLLIFIVLVIFNRNIPRLRALIYIGALMCSVFILTPVVKSYDLNQRVLLIYYVICFIAAMQQVYTNQYSQKIYSICKSFSLIFVVLIVIQLFLITNARISLYKFEQNRNELVAKYQKEHVADPTLPCLGYMGPTVFNDDIISDKDMYNNKVYAEYYGFNSVVCTNVITPK